VPELAPRLAQQAVEFVNRLRKLDLKKSPPVSETLDWAKALVALNAKAIDQDTLNTTLTVLLKHESDVNRARRTAQTRSRGDDEDDGYRQLPPSLRSRRN
jgi:hypothetical protein